MTYRKTNLAHIVDLYEGKYDDDVITKNFSENLRIERERLRLSYVELGKLIKVSKTTLCDLEAGRSTIMFVTAVKIAHGLNKTIEEMID